ncbi:hypothetical protein [Roseibium sp. MMSF_3412]|uniref:hypothetical protein n=1 Tax=Roseibium sp. MMSF_3412 TaxID=3046712 RepID=UPI00273EC036|nr:hypothetical protein [Roseibium sp. MMSF_3412]
MIVRYAARIDLYFRVLVLIALVIGTFVEFWDSPHFYQSVAFWVWMSMIAAMLTTTVIRFANPETRRKGTIQSEEEA